MNGGVKPTRRSERRRFWDGGGDLSAIPSGILTTQQLGLQAFLLDSCGCLAVS